MRYWGNIQWGTYQLDDLVVRVLSDRAAPPELNPQAATGLPTDVVLERSSIRSATQCFRAQRFHLLHLLAPTRRQARESNRRKARPRIALVYSEGIS
jgi:hypothetical protein